MICSSRRCRPQPVLRARLRSDITLNTRFPTSPSRTYKIDTAQYLERVETFQASIRVGTQINRGTVMDVRFLQTPDCQVVNDPRPRMLNLCLVIRVILETTSRAICAACRTPRRRLENSYDLPLP